MQLDRDFSEATRAKLSNCLQLAHRLIFAGPLIARRPQSGVFPPVTVNGFCCVSARPDQAAPAAGLLISRYLRLNHDDAVAHRLLIGDVFLYHRDVPVRAYGKFCCGRAMTSPAQLNLVRSSTKAGLKRSRGHPCVRGLRGLPCVRG